MSLSNMKVFNEYLKKTTIETLAQDVEKFNAASAGSIRLTTQGIDGDFLWVRRGGNAYVVRDAGVLAGVTSAWRPVDALEVRMDALQTRMQPGKGFRYGPVQVGIDDNLGVCCQSAQLATLQRLPLLQQKRLDPRISASWPQKTGFGE